MNETHRTVQQAAEQSYGRLIAFLASRSHDLAAAEDALSDAILNALESWPVTGIPDKPEAWLLTAARRRLIDAARHAQVHTAATPALTAIANEAQTILESGIDFPDERLRLLFVCAHPAIDIAVRTPLMLQTVLHLDAVRIASAFLVKPSAMGQRLSRAKVKIRDAAIPFEIPSSKALPARLNAVLEAIYAAYASGWDDVAGADPRRKGLAEEAIILGRLLLQLLPAEPESQGMLALMLFCEARRPARRTSSGQYVPLSEQNTQQWTRPMIEEADRLLARAASFGTLGRFQLEAAIQSVHAQRLFSGSTDWSTIVHLYEGLVSVAPTVGAIIGHAAAVGEARGPAAGLELLALLASEPPESIQTYQPYWALKAHLLKRLHRTDEARTAYSRAIGLCEDEAMRTFLAANMP